MYKVDQELLVFQSSMWQMNSVFYRNEAAVIVVDPGYFPTEIRILANLAKRSKGFVRYLVFTHSDFDHIVGHQDFIGFQQIGHRSFVEADSNSQLEQLAELDQTYNVKRIKEVTFPEIDITVEESMVIPLAEDNLIINHIPGHTADSICVVSEKKGTIIVGDYLSDLEFPFVYYSFRKYLDSLKKMRQLVERFRIHTVIPGHGECATESREIFYRLNTDVAYLEEIVERVTDFCARGIPVKEIVEILKDMSFRGEKITGALVKMHMENIRKAVTEVTEE